MSAIASFSAKEFLAMLATASEEERAAIGALLPTVPAPKKAATAKVAAAASEKRPPADLSSRPDMPDDPELDEDFCHARRPVVMADKLKIDGQDGDFLGRESGLKFGGFCSKIFLSQQCTSKPSKGEILCSGCQKNFGKHDQAKWTVWLGLIGEAPPPKCRSVGSEYSAKVYEAWGDAPRSGPSSAKKSSGGEPAAKKAEPKAKAEPKPKAKKEDKPSNAAAAPAAVAAVAPAPAAEPKKVVISIPDDLVENSELSCFINSEGTCFYADFDEDTLESIPDMSRIIGSIPKGVDRETATKKDYTEAEEPEEQADE